MFLVFRILRYIYFLIVLFFFTLGFFILSFLPGSFVRRTFPNLYKSWSRQFFLIFGIDEHVHHEHRSPLPEKYILISNHPSGIELLWLPGKFNIIPLAKYEIQDWFIVGRIVKSIGTIFVKRKDFVSRHAASDALLEVVKSGKNILLFPEGGCYGKNLNPFFMGAFHLSKQTGVPLLPVYLHYEEEDTYEWGDYGLIKFIGRALWLPENRNAHLYIFDAISPDLYSDEKEFHDQVYSFYQDLEKKYMKH